MMVAVGSRLVLHGGWCVRRLRAAPRGLDLFVLDTARLAAPPVL
jgi:hypothetical protein